MNEKCSLDNLSRYLRVIGLLSLIIILIIVVYYYLQSNHSSILEKYEGYSRRDCVVYLKGDIADTQKCDATQGTSNYTDTCSYRFDGWSEFDTYTDKDGKTIPYPKKIYTLTNTNSGSFTNPMFTNNCFKPNTSEEDGIPQEFEYNANNVVRYDEQGTSGNTAVGTNIFGGSRYSSMQFLNTPNPTDNYNTLLDSICSASTKALGSLKDSAFYMFEFDGTTNKLTNITSVALNDDQTTFSISSKYNVLTNLPPIITPLKNAYGIQYDTNAKALKIFKKNNIEKEVLVYKFNYMSYVCPQSQIKNYMRARRMITPDKFIKYGAATTPNYSKNIQISNMNINKDWDWNYYKSDDMNFDYSVALKTDLSTAINSRERDIKISYKPREDIAEKEYRDADAAFTAASTSRTNFSTNFPTFTELIGITKKDNTRVFDYISGYNTSSIDNLNISIPQGANATKVGTDICITFPYTGSESVKTYTFTTTEILTCDILIVGGGGGGGSRHGGGGGGGAVIYHTGQNLSIGRYTILIGSGGAGAKNIGQGKVGNDSGIAFNSTTLYLAKGGGSGYHAISTGNSNRDGGSGGGGGDVAGAAVSTNIPSRAYGNSGGILSTGSPSDYGGGGGGGAGASGFNSLSIGGRAIAGKGGDGRQISINGTATYYGGGGGGGIFEAGNLVGQGGLGGGGTGSMGSAKAMDGSNGTGGGGGGGGFTSSGNAIGGDGGSGIVIIRIRINNDNIIAPFKNLDTNIDRLYSSETLANPSKIIIDASSIQSKILTAFIFLQKGYYYFKAGINGGSYNPSMMIYSDLLIFEKATNSRIVYKNNNGVHKYFNIYIYIPDSKFYKLAYRYTIYNSTSNRIDANFVLDCNYKSPEPPLNPNAYVSLNSTSNNVNENYSINNSSFELSLNDYLFYGVNLNTHYTNANKANIIARFANVKYTSNNQATNYASIIEYLDSINFFNITALQTDRTIKFDFMNKGLPDIIRANYLTDPTIINIRSIIKIIDDLKSSNPSINYTSHLPTITRSIYNNATIDEIFGKNYERLITKERVSNYNEISDTKTIRPKKIYVEAVA
jgi:hypothetical protein